MNNLDAGDFAIARAEIRAAGEGEIDRLGPVATGIVADESIEDEIVYASRGKP